MLDVDHHLLVDVRVPHDFTELLKADFAIVVLIRKEDCLVDYLLQLGVLQVVTHHHFQNLQQNVFES